MEESDSPRAPVSKLATTTVVLSVLVTLPAVLLGIAIWAMCFARFSVEGYGSDLVVTALTVLAPCVLILSPIGMLTAIIALIRIKLSHGKLRGYGRAWAGVGLILVVNACLTAAVQWFFANSSFPF